MAKDLDLLAKSTEQSPELFIVQTELHHALLWLATLIRLGTSASANTNECSQILVYSRRGDAILLALESKRCYSWALWSQCRVVYSLRDCAKAVKCLRWTFLKIKRPLGSTFSASWRAKQLRRHIKATTRITAEVDVIRERKVDEEKGSGEDWKVESVRTGDGSCRRRFRKHDKRRHDCRRSSRKRDSKRDNQRRGSKCNSKSYYGTNDDFERSGGRRGESGRRKNCSRSKWLNFKQLAVCSLCGRNFHFELLPQRQCNENNQSYQKKDVLEMKRHLFWRFWPEQDWSVLRKKKRIYKSGHNSVVSEV